MQILRLGRPDSEAAVEALHEGWQERVADL